MFKKSKILTENMNNSEGRVLYVATNFLFTRFGGGLASRIYYEASKEIFGDILDLALPEEEAGKIIDIDDNFYVIRRRNKIVAVVSSIFGSIHRTRRFLISFFQKKWKSV
jgi:hypothetical protein